MNQPIDAVVLGSGLNALGVLRSLGPSGIRIALVSRDEIGIAARSRYARVHLNLPRDRFGPQEVAGKLGVRDNRPVLFLTEELDIFSCLADVAGWSSVFTNYFYTPETANALLSKRSFEELANESGSLVPKTLVVRTAAELENLELPRFPLIVKPAHRDDGYSRQFEKAYRVEDEKALHELVDRLSVANVELIVQEWVEGKDTDIYFNLTFVDRSGKMRTSFVGRKVLCWPPDVGGTASCVAAPDFHDQLTGYTESFLNAIGFRGLIGIEYKRDRRDGEFYMIEPTVYRTDYQHEIATLCGCNILLDAYRSCVEDDTPVECGYFRSRHWMDFPASRYSAQSSDTDDEASRGASRVDAYFRWTDPLPGLVHHGRFLLQAVKGMIV